MKKLALVLAIALLLALPYGPEGVVTSVKADYFEQEALGLFGCSADSQPPLKRLL